MHINQPKVPTLHAYLACPLTVAQLDRVHTEFEFGSFARFATTHHLFIHDELRYHGMSHVDMRRDLDGQGMMGDFLILDEKVDTDKAAWIVQRLVSQEDVDDGQAVSTQDVWEILTRIEHIPIVEINYHIANMSIQEDLDNCGVKWPYGPRAHPQTEIHSSGIDMRKYQYQQSAYLVAEPGEYEEAPSSPAPEGSSQFLMLGGGGRTPSKLYRLTPNLASQHGLVSKWWLATTAGAQFPEGSISLSQPWNPDHDFPLYERLQESL
jgi:hypothetical protein